MTDSPFGPQRKWGEPQWDPNDMLALVDEAHWQSIRDVLGDTGAIDTAVIHELSAEEREMARLTATFPALADPTNTVAMQTAPIVTSKRRQAAIGWAILAGLALSGTLVIVGAWTVVTWAVSR